IFVCRTGVSSDSPQAFYKSEGIFHPGETLGAGNDTASDSVLYVDEDKWVTNNGIDTQVFSIDSSGSASFVQELVGGVAGGNNMYSGDYTMAFSGNVLYAQTLFSPYIRAFTYSGGEFSQGLNVSGILGYAYNLMS